MPGALKVRDPGTGVWRAISLAGAQGPPGNTGPQGETGPQGPTGVSSIIVGNFGAVATPADLPPNGLLPIDWDGPGNPAAPLQMNLGESLYYDPAVLPDPLDGHLFQYVGTTTDPSGWIDIGLIQGPPGVAGPVGPTGADGVDGDPGPTGPSGGPIPMGGTANQAVTKIDAVDGNVQWSGPYLPIAGGSVSGDINTYSRIIHRPNTDVPATAIMGHWSETQWEIKGWGGASAGNGDGGLKIHTNQGGYGAGALVASFDVMSGGGRLYLNGQLDARDVIDRTPTAATASDVADLGLDVAGRLIDAIRPVTFRSLTPPGEGATVEPAPSLRVGIAPAEVEGSELADRLMRIGGERSDQPGVDTDPDHRGYSVPGLLAVAIAEIKSLRARVAQLEGNTP